MSISNCFIVTASKNQLNEKLIYKQKFDTNPQMTSF